MISKKFRVDIVGDLEYEDLIADIYYDDEIVAMLSQETGFDNMEIEIYSPKKQATWQFKFSEFEDVIQFAKKRLWELRRADESA